MRRTRLLTLASIALAAAALAPAAGAAPAVDGVLDLSGQPNHLALGPDGNVWVALTSTTADWARIAPDGAVTEFDSPQVLNPRGIAAGPDGRMWVTQLGGVAHFSPANPTVATSVGIVSLNNPRAIVAGPDGNLWTADEDLAIRIGTDGRFSELRVDGMGSRGIAAGNGRLYVADFGGRRVVELTTDGIPTFLPLPEAPQEVATGPGGQVAATMPSNLLGRLTPPATDVLTSDVPGADPFGIAFADDGAYWTANFARDSLTRLTPSGQLTTLTGLPAGSGPRYLTRGAGGTLWVGLETSRQVARVKGVTSPPPPPPPGGDVTPPVVSRPRLPRSLRVGRAGTLRVTLSEAATLTVRFERRLPGRRKAGRCVRPRRALQGRRCTRLAAAGAQRRAARAGANALRVGGRIGRRTLPIGAYRLTIVARDAAGNASRPLTRSLRVTPPPRRRR
jgi:DNA-binding beta-propeller fold protein YncE